MQRKQMYTAITAVIFLIQLYSVGTSVYFYFFKYSFYFSWINFISLIPGILGLSGAAIFYFSDFKKSVLLRLYMCLETASFPLSAWFYFQYFNRSGDFVYTSGVSVSMVVGILLFVLLTTACSAGLWRLTAEQQIRLTFIQQDNERIGQFEPARANTRFLNRLVDLAVIFFLIFLFANQFRLFSSSLFSYRNNYMGLSILEIPFTLLYYLLLEGIFNTTAGKCVTGSTIVNAYGKRPHFGQVLGHTFCRLIPFEALSFLGARSRGWHDSISGTYVVNTAPAETAMEEITFDAEKETT